MATISNKTYALLDVVLPATSATYDLLPIDTKNNILEKVYLDVDATNGDITINLPDIGIFGRIWNFEVVITRVDSSLNAVKVIPFDSVVPPIQQYIGSNPNATQIQTRYESLTCTPVSDYGWSADFTGGGTLSLAQYVDLPIGTIFMVADYNSTSIGCTIVKTSLAGSDYTDWRILATDGFLSTGAIATNPI